MAITRKSKMGSMLGVKPSEVATPVAAVKNSQNEQAEKALSQVVPSTGNKPRFELIQGEEEKKINLHMPANLYKAVSIQAKMEDKTLKQFLGEMVLQVMMEKYDFKP